MLPKAICKLILLKLGRFSSYHKKYADVQDYHHAPSSFKNRHSSISLKYQSLQKYDTNSKNIKTSRLSERISNA